DGSSHELLAASAEHNASSAELFGASTMLDTTSAVFGRTFIVFDRRSIGLGRRGKPHLASRNEGLVASKAQGKPSKPGTRCVTAHSTRLAVKNGAPWMPTLKSMMP